MQQKQCLIDDKPNTLNNRIAKLADALCCVRPSGDIGDYISIRTEVSEFDGRAPRAQLFFQIKP
ncbi:MAG: hypothetical protein ACKVPZ_12265 [Burkholderiaceae bacterium]